MQRVTRARRPPRPRELGAHDLRSHVFRSPSIQPECPTAWVPISLMIVVESDVPKVIRCRHPWRLCAARALYQISTGARAAKALVVGTRPCRRRDFRSGVDTPPCAADFAVPANACRTTCAESQVCSRTGELPPAVAGDKPWMRPRVFCAAAAAATCGALLLLAAPPDPTRRLTSVRALTDHPMSWQALSTGPCVAYAALRVRERLAIFA